MPAIVSPDIKVVIIDKSLPEIVASKLEVELPPSKPFMIICSGAEFEAAITKVKFLVPPVPVETAFQVPRYLSRSVVIMSGSVFSQPVIRNNKIKVKSREDLFIFMKSVGISIALQ